MKYLIAGGAGFIGSHLADALVGEGHEVVSVDNLLIGKIENIKHLYDNPNFTSYIEDLADFRKLNKIFRDEKFDYVFHLAANSDIQAGAKSPEIDLRNTFLTTYNILECMRLHGVNKLFFSSTSAVYGEKTEIALKEDTVPLEPISYYGAAKLSSEAFITAYSFMNDFRSLIFRFPNVIGSRITHGVIFDFISKLNENTKELMILGDGNQNKPFMHISDLISGIIMMKDIVDSGVSLYNIGVETKSDVTKIANIVCEEMNMKNVKFKYTGGNTGWKGDVPTFGYCLEKIHSAGWCARYSSDEAVRKTVKEVLS